MDLREITIKYGGLVVFIRHDSAEIRGFRFGLTLGIGILKTMASTCVFVRVVSALKRSIQSFSCSPCLISVFSTFKQNLSSQFSISALKIHLAEEPALKPNHPCSGTSRACPWANFRVRSSRAELATSGP